MTSGILAGLGGGAVLILAALYFGLVASTVIMPFVLISVARSLRGILHEMQRANDTRVTYTAPPTYAAQQVVEHVAPRDLGHQLLR